MRALLTLTPIVLLGAVACGGTQGERPSAGFEAGGGAPPVTDPCEADDGLEFSMIEDFEDGRAQRWWTGADGTPGYTMEPPDDRESPESNELDTPRCGTSRYGLHIRATGLKVYGGSFGTSFLVQYPEGWDVSDYEGLSLWVKREGGPGASLFIALNDQYTDGTAGSALRGEPACDDNSLTESKKCDRFGAGVRLTDEWQFVAIPFTAMKQRGYGVIAPYLDTEALAGLNASFEAGDWDFIIDDVGFYRHAK